MGETKIFNLDADGFQNLLQHLTSTPHQRNLLLEVHKDDHFVMSYNVSNISMNDVLDFYNRWTYYLDPHSHHIFDTGVKVEFPAGYVGLLKPKGGQLSLVGSGVIEWTYQGNIMFRLFNPTDESIYIPRGEALGQMILVSNLEFHLEEVETEKIHQGFTKRGATGGIVLGGE